MLLKHTLRDRGGFGETWKFTKVVQIGLPVSYPWACESRLPQA